MLVGLLGSSAARERALEALSLPVPGRIAGILGTLESAEGELPALLVSALARMHGPDARAALLSVLEMSSAPARQAAVEALGALQLLEGREALERAAAHDPDAEVRRLASVALVR